MSALPGTWDVRLRTPLGTLQVRYRFDEAAGGFSGTAIGSAETVPLTDIAVEPAGDGSLRVTWRQRVTRPMRLNLDFDVTVTGDTMTGHSRAGRLPRTSVSGLRAPAFS